MEAAPLPEPSLFHPVRPMGRQAGREQAILIPIMPSSKDAARKKRKCGIMAGVGKVNDHPLIQPSPNVLALRVMPSSTSTSTALHAPPTPPWTGQTIAFRPSSSLTQSASTAAVAAPTPPSTSSALTVRTAATMPPSSSSPFSVLTLAPSCSS